MPILNHFKHKCLLSEQENISYKREHNRITGITDAHVEQSITYKRIDVYFFQALLGFLILFLIWNRKINHWNVIQIS